LEDAAMRRAIVLVIVVCAVAAFAAAVGGCKSNEHKEGMMKPQTECPILGGNVDKKYYADYNGKRLYFCCQACVQEFNRDPDKYMKKMAEAGVMPEDSPQAMMNMKPQTVCPVSGKPIDKNYYVDHNGKGIYFCCPNCPAEFNKDPEKYMKKMADEGVMPENTP
jgi:YHS domain-containing protein